MMGFVDALYPLFITYALISLTPSWMYICQGNSHPSIKHLRTSLKQTVKKQPGEWSGYPDHF